MKHKLLLFSLLFACGVLNAQDTIKHLVISEARLNRGDKSYVELTNMSTTDTVDLLEFEFGTIRPWADPWIPEAQRFFRFNWDVFAGQDPEIWELLPGESFVMGSAKDWMHEKWQAEGDKFGYSPNYTEQLTWPELYEIADLMIHSPEAPTPDPTDSVTRDDVYGDISLNFSDIWNGRECWYIRHWVTETDSAVVDQVAGVFDVDGRNSTAGAFAVAGVGVDHVDGATANHTLIRKFTVKEGNLDFATGRGISLEDSEWIPVPFLPGNGYNITRRLFWTVGNHVDVDLDATTLTSDNPDIAVDWVDSTVTVPWGVRNDDSIMMQFDYSPCFAWAYEYSEVHEDSAYESCRTGDQFIVYACGNDRDKGVFDVLVLPPKVTDNIVVPKNAKANDGWYDGGYTPYEVSDGIPGMDTISDIPYAERVDTLLKYLEKAPNASWEIDWVDDIVRVDLKDGDKLIVTAEDGTSVKEYYIKVQEYRADDNAYLSSITWPDIPDVEYYRVVYDWMGDTIPGFTTGKFSYKVLVPFDVPGIPALIPKTADQNAAVVTKRARTLYGGPEDRMISFEVMAEDDSTDNVYSVLLDKEKDPQYNQKWIGAEPFFSEVIFWEQWSNGFVEVVNPGTEFLDLSNYMFVAIGGETPTEAIQWPTEATGETWRSRYNKYIPGYIWQDSTNWKVEPCIAVQDPTISTLIVPGDVFVAGGIWTTGQAYSGGANAYTSDTWPAELACDVIFNHPSKLNTWGDSSGHVDGVWCRKWTGANMYMFKILNDSIHTGEKAANDPADFELIETWGGEGDPWGFGTDYPGYEPFKQIDMITSCVRKPQYFLPKTGIEESFGDSNNVGEWDLYDRPWFQGLGVPWPMDILRVAQDLGTHYMNDVMYYRSTVSSLSYKVSPGFSRDELIRGVVDGTTVSEFIDNLILADTAQTLTLHSVADGSVLGDEDVLADGDSLVVISANLVNTSAYMLEVTATGLGHDATLTSTTYDVSPADPFTVRGMDYGTLLKDVVATLSTTDPNATMTIVDGNDAYVSLKVMNFDTMLVDVPVSDDIYFEVIAEDGTTTILYQLTPNATSSSAFVTSAVFTIDQVNMLIKLIPGGTTVQALMKNIVPAPGATVKLVDKLGHERMFGNIVRDDKLVVTSEDETVTVVYYISMLPAEDETVDYLAFVLSDDYIVNQVALTITGIDKNINQLLSVDDFKANLTPASGASIMVVDADDVENTGDLVEGNLLKVVAADGVTSAYYVINVELISVNDISDGPITLYPNPSAGILNITGLETGNRIQIYNMLGEVVRDMIAYQSQEVISLNQPAGIYFVVVSDNDEIIGRQKLILK